MDYSEIIAQKLTLLAECLKDLSKDIQSCQEAVLKQYKMIEQSFESLCCFGSVPCCQLDCGSDLPDVFRMHLHHGLNPSQVERGPERVYFNSNTTKEKSHDCKIRDLR